MSANYWPFFSGFSELNSFKLIQWSDNHRDDLSVTTFPLHHSLPTVHPGGSFNIKMSSYQIGNPIVEIRRSYDRLISTMGFPILVRLHLYIELGPCTHPFTPSCPNNTWYLVNGYFLLASMFPTSIWLLNGMVFCCCQSYLHKLIWWWGIACFYTTTKRTVGCTISHGLHNNEAGPIK